jgi:hypothetical protein
VRNKEVRMYNRHPSVSILKSISVYNNNYNMEIKFAVGRGRERGKGEGNILLYNTLVSLICPHNATLIPIHQHHPSPPYH